MVGSSMKVQSSLVSAGLRLEALHRSGVEVRQVRVRVEVARRLCALLDRQDVRQQQVWDLQSGDQLLLDVVFEGREEDRQNLVDEAAVGHAVALDEVFEESVEVLRVVHVELEARFDDQLEVLQTHWVNHWYLSASCACRSGGRCS